MTTIAQSLSNELTKSQKTINELKEKIEKDKIEFAKKLEDITRKTIEDFKTQLINITKNSTVVTEELTNLKKTASIFNINNR